MHIGKSISYAKNKQFLPPYDTKEILNKIFNISKNSNKRIIQNLFFAFIYNIIMIPIAVSGSIVPSMAALAMALSSLSVVLNSSRKL